MNDFNIHKKRIIYSAIIPLVTIIILWIIKLIEFGFDFSLYNYGISPRNYKNIQGIVFSFFIHSDFKHLIANSTTLFILLWMLYFFYKDLANYIFLFSILLSGFFTFIIVRESYHIGASGVIYSLSFFLIFSSFVRKNKKLTAASLLVIFLYGSMIWNMIPLTEIIDPKISWEGHLSGALSGIILAILYKNKGPENDKIVLDDTDEIDEDDINDSHNDNIDNLDKNDIVKKKILIIKQRITPLHQ